jgi:hypothetical protein
MLSEALGGKRMSQADTSLEIDDAIVLLLGAPSRSNRVKGKIEGITRLEKLIFLLERETKSREWLTEDAKFDAYNFGPFSAKVYQAVDLLSAASLVVDSGAIAENSEDTWEMNNVIGEIPGGADQYSTRDFALTERGWRYYNALTSRLPPGAVEEITDLKDKFATLPLRQLIRYVYQRYDSFTKNSIIRDDILGH